MKSPIQLEQQIQDLNCVSKTEYMNVKRYIDFRIGQKSSFPKHRASYSRIVYDETSDMVVKGTLRVVSKTHSSYTGEGEALAQTLDEGIKIAVIDSVIHIYLTQDVLHRPRKILRILMVIENSYENTLFENLHQEIENGI